MLILQISLQGVARFYPLTGTLTIGRALDNDVVIENPHVSRHHAVLRESGPVALLVDLGSASGSRLNGRALEPRVEAAVRAGDTIGIAELELTLTESTPLAVPDEPTQTAQAPQQWPAVPPGTTVLAGPNVPPSAQARARMEIATRAGTQYVKLEADQVSLGRAAGNDVVVEADVISRQHLLLRRVGSGYVVDDLGSTNGFSVSGRRVASHVLQNGDVLDVAGEVELRYYLEAPARLAAEEQELALPERMPITIGRDETCGIQLPHPMVSRFHARISAGAGGRHVVEDLGSTNGTFLNGVRLVGGAQQPFAPNDVLQIGPIRLQLGDRRNVRQRDSSGDVVLTGVQLHKRVSKRLDLLQGISLGVQPNEFVAVVGASGAGKSTLLGALSGLRPASDGVVLLNGIPLYEHFDEFRTSLGYVPQDDILHRELPLVRALGYAAELRLPADTTAAERHGRIDAVVRQLGLEERRDTPINRLSGGERKRVSIAAELLTQPGLFFLDEATSGLDPGTESELMRLLRTLADDGRTVILVTHATKNVMLCDQVVFLAKGGYLAYCGPPDQALTYFGVSDFDGIYVLLAREKGEESARRFAQSEQYQRFVQARLAEVQHRVDGLHAAAPLPDRGTPHARRTSSSFFRQLSILSRRYFDIIRRDRVNLALMFLLAPLLGVINFLAWPRDIMSLQSGDLNRALSMFFCTALIPFLVGALSAVREIVKEGPIYARERAVCLGIGPYLASKVVISLLFAFYHAGALFIMLVLAVEFPGVSTQDMVELYITLVITVMSGVMWALLISTLTSKEEQAMLLVVVLIVLQVVFSGATVPLSSLGPAGLVIGSITSTAWSFKATAAAGGFTKLGCVDDFADCHLPGFGSLSGPLERQVVFKNFDKPFGEVLDANLYLCWLALITMAVVLAIGLYLLQRRKDVL